MVDEFAYNVASIVICFVLLLGYVFTTYSINFFFPDTKHKIQLTKFIGNSFLWAQKHREKNDPASVTLAIQTLRNTILIAVFVGGSSLTAAISVISTYSEALSLYHQIRIVILSSFLFISFLSWANVIRTASYLGYLTGVLSYEEPNRIPMNINSPDDISLSQRSPPKYEEVNDQRIRQEQILLSIMFVSFSVGFKLQFISIPFFLYVIGPNVLIISTVFMICFMYSWDNIYNIGALLVEEPIKQA